MSGSSNGQTRQSSRVRRPSKRARGDDSDEEETPREVSPAPSEAQTSSSKSSRGRKSLSGEERFNEKYKPASNSPEEIRGTLFFTMYLLSAC